MTDFKLIIGNKNYSSWSLRGWLAVALSGVEFEETLLPLDTDEFLAKSPSLLPSGTVPVLYHGDVVVWDSLAIIDYMDRQTGGAYWPENSKAYAFAKSICAEMHSSLYSLRAHCPMNMREQFKGLQLASKVQKDIDRVESLWTRALTDFSGAGPYLFGATMTAADIMFAPVVSRLRTYDIALNDQCEDYRAAVERHPAYQSWYTAALKEEWIVDQDEIDRDIKILGAVGAE